MSDSSSLRDTFVSRLCALAQSHPVLAFCIGPVRPLQPFCDRTLRQAIQVWLCPEFNLSGTLILSVHQEGEQPRVCLVSSAKKLAFLTSLFQRTKGSSVSVKFSLFERHELQQAVTAWSEAMPKANEIHVFPSSSDGDDEFELDFRTRFLEGKFRLLSAELGIFDKCMTTKDAHAQQLINDAATLCNAALQLLRRRIQGMLDLDGVIQPAKLADFVFSSLSLSEWAFRPLVQGIGTHALKPRAAVAPIPAQHNEFSLVYQRQHRGLSPLLPSRETDVFICSLGVQHGNYRLAATRTFLLKPTFFQLYALNVASVLVNFALKSIRPGVAASAVYRLVEEEIKKRAPGLLPNFVKSMGHGIGLQFREPLLSITSTCDEPFRLGQLLLVTIGFADLYHEVGACLTPKYSLASSNTVLVQAAQAKNLTNVVGSERLTTRPGMSGSLIPTEVLLLLFQYLDTPSRLQASAVCKHWRSIPWNTVDLSQCFPRDCTFHIPCSSMCKQHLRVSWQVRPTMNFLKGRRAGGFNRFDGEEADSHQPIQPPDLVIPPIQVFVLGKLSTPQFKTVTVLCLNRCQNIDPNDFAVIGSNFPILRELYLKGIRVASQEREEIFRILGVYLAEADCPVRVLSLAASGLTSTDLRFFAPVLQQGKLEIFDVRHNLFLGDAGAEALARILKRVPALRRCLVGIDEFASWTASGISPLGLQSLRAALEDNLRFVGAFRGHLLLTSSQDRCRAVWTERSSMKRIKQSCPPDYTATSTTHEASKAALD
eukprot:m.286423 g.286423  ORF g.286423 m.286423 type:complete len:767 (-) comp54987_c0_seq4:1631-3931(-)